MKIRHKIILGFFTVALAFVILDYVSIDISKQYLRKVIGSDSVMLAGEVMNRIDRSIYYKIEAMQIYSKTFLLQEALLESNAEFDQLADVQGYIKDKDQEWVLTGRTITPFVQELLDTAASRKLIERMDSFEQKYEYPVFSEIFITNKYGANVVLSQKTTDYYQADEEWWQLAKRNGLYIEDVSYDDSSQDYSISISLRVTDKDGQFLGVIKAVLSLNDIIYVIRDLSFSGQDRPYGHVQHLYMTYMLVNNQGKVIYSAGSEDYQILSDMPPQIFSWIRNNKNGYFVISNGGVGKKKDRVVSCFKSKGFRDYEGLDWTFVVAHDAREIFTPVSKLEFILWSLLVASVAIIIIISMVISYAITGALKKLMQGVAAVRVGDLDVEMGIKSRDEIGQLGRDFDNMVRDLRSAREELKTWAKTLEQRVQDRTKELREVNLEQERTKKELEKKVDQLQRFTKVAVGRELKMIELKEKIEQLEKKRDNGN